MRRFNILAGSALLILILFGVTISASSPARASGKKPPLSADLPKKSLRDQKEEALYKSRQKELYTALEAYFEKAIASGDIVGAGVSIVRGDSIVLADGYGKRRAGSAGRIDRHTVFRLGSLSKGFAGVLAAQVKREGGLAWSDRVVDYLPQFQLGDKVNTEKITLAHILSHSSGAPYHSYTNLVEAGLPLRDIAGRFREVKPIGDPGEIYSYQNALFALSGEIITQVSGEDLATALQKRLFNPLGMCTTSMDHETLEKTENVAMPHSKTRYGWKPRKFRDNYYNAIAAGGINANAIDMARWMRFLLGHNPEVMEPAAIEEAFTPFVEIKGHNKYYQRWPGHISSHYGFGWRVHKFREEGSEGMKTIWHHGGSVNNYRNEIALFPEADVGICVLLNGYSRLAKNVIPDLYAIVKDIYGLHNAPASDFESIASNTASQPE